MVPAVGKLGAGRADHDLPPGEYTLVNGETARTFRAEPKRTGRVTPAVHALAPPFLGVELILPLLPA